MFSISIFSNKIYALEDNIAKTDFFPIGVYYVMGQKSADQVPTEDDIRYSPQVAYDEYFQEFQDLKSYGFNTAIVMINPLVLPSADETRANNVINGLISAAEDASLQIVPTMANIATLLNENHETLTEQTIIDTLSSDYIDLFIASSATLGYQIYDEPIPNGNIEVQLGQIKDAVSQLDTNAFALSTWHNIDTMGQLNEGMNPDVLLMDTYPFAVDAYNGDQADGDTPFGDISDAFPRGREDDGSFNLGVDQLTYTQWMNEAQNIVDNKPVWVAFQAFGGDTYWRNPIPKELRLQSFIAIKNGAKGLFYFMY